MRRKYCSATFLKTMQKSRWRELVARVISVKSERIMLSDIKFFTRHLSSQCIKRFSYLHSYIHRKAYRITLYYILIFF